MTDNEIMKALNKIAKYSGFTDDVRNTLELTLDLINRLQAENDDWEKQFRILDVECSRLEKQTEELQAENEKLQKYNTEYTRKRYQDGKADAIKEFAERLNEKQ